MPAAEPRYAAVLIAASSGGVEALRQLLPALRAGLPLRVVVLLHTQGSSAGPLCEALAQGCALPLHAAEHGALLSPGQICVAPPGYHLLMEKDARCALSLDARVCHVRPSADVLFASAADAWRERLIGVVLTGANEDGAQGLAAIRSRGGLAIVQDPAEAESPQMPRAALEQAGADHVLPLARIAPLLNQLAAA